MIREEDTEARTRELAAILQEDSDSDTLLRQLLELIGHVQRELVPSKESSAGEKRQDHIKENLQLGIDNFMRKLKSMKAKQMQQALRESLSRKISDQKAQILEQEADNLKQLHQSKMQELHVENA